MPDIIIGDSPAEDTGNANVSRISGARSASPAKRSAADMEGRQEGDVEKYLTSTSQENKTHFDEAMDRMNMDTQETAQSSVPVQMTGSDSEATPPYSSQEDMCDRTAQETAAEIDEKVKKVYQLQEKALDEGQKAVIVSNKWLDRVLSRRTESLEDPKYPKGAREGAVGAVDNSDIVPDGAFAPPHLRDMEGRTYIPLKPGLSMEDDFTPLNDDSWREVLASYELASGQYQIDRYVKNTAQTGADLKLQYEIYPPIFTIRKVQSSHDTGRPKPTSALLNLVKSADQKARGQYSPDDAVHLVSSRNEKFQSFLRRSKQAAEIPVGRKVRIWKIINSSRESLNKPLSPPLSRDPSPNKTTSSNPKLVVEAAVFNDMELGRELEHVDAKDETNNGNYNGSSTMDTYGLFEDATLLLEEIMDGPGGGEFMSDSKKAVKVLMARKVNSRSISATASGRTSPAPGGGGIMTRGRQRRDGRTRGTIGLSNLGNTCYMNSALQCIRSVEELAIYFLMDKYKKEINSDNPLGHGGAMAKQYAGVVNSIYSENATSAFSPNAFKRTLGSLQPLFSGYGQQDSQEFLSFLVDALHEDLNRIYKKPYIENPDSDDSTVHDPKAIVELGETYRANHRARNDSVAMDLFNGFYKNTMECPDCDKISITFDPYSLVTLQLPIENTFQHTITFVPRRRRPVNHLLDLDKSTSIKGLKEKIASKYAGIDPARLWMVELYDHKNYRVFENATTLAEANIQPSDHLALYELDAVPSNVSSPSKKKMSSGYHYSSVSTAAEEAPDMSDPKADNFVVPLFSRRQSVRDTSGSDFFLEPVYITVTREEAKDYESILRKVLIAASRLTSLPVLTEMGPVDIDMADALTPNEDSEESAQVSDRSVPSEDGYVEVSVDKHAGQGYLSGSSGVASRKVDDRPVPSGFMTYDHFVTPELRSQLFDLKVAKGNSGNLHCTGMNSFPNRSVRNMYERVKKPSRRSSVQSTVSGDSTTSTASGLRTNGESEESEADDMDKPDVTMGGETHVGESYLGMPSAADDESDNGSLPENALNMQREPRKGRGKTSRGARRNRRQKTYSRKDRQNHRQNRVKGNGNVQGDRFGDDKFPRDGSDDDNPFYIKLGEAIILDWHRDAVESLFNGDPAVEGDMRGYNVFESIAEAQDLDVEEKRRRREERRKHGITLEDCFAETGKREVLSEDNAWYCNRCKKLQRATKTLDIWTMPDILVVHLKRFGGNRSFRDKIDTMVKYPIEGLDMTEKVGFKEDGKDYVYDLFAVDNHFGGLGGGHYTAMAKNFYDGQWYDYNDSSCSKIGERSLRSAAAYLLFYRRRSEKPLGPRYLQDMVYAFRAPSTAAADSAAEETADESDAGEVKLGDPASSLRNGSSSISPTAAGARAVIGLGQDDGGVGIAPVRADNNPTTTLTTETMSQQSDEGETHIKPFFGPQRPPPHQADATWSFASLDRTTKADDAAEDLLNEVDYNDEDVASDAAEIASTGERMDDFDNDLDNTKSAVTLWSNAGRNSPVDAGTDLDELHHDHSMYSDARESHDANIHGLHLEDTGALGDDGVDADPPTHEIVLGDPSLSEADARTKAD